MPKLVFVIILFTFVLITITICYSIKCKSDGNGEISYKNYKHLGRMIIADIGLLGLTCKLILATWILRG